MTDALPLSVQFARWGEKPAGAEVKAGEITWNGIERKIRVRGYPVFSGKYRRIILLTKPMVSDTLDDNEFDEDMPYPFPEY